MSVEKQIVLTKAKNIVSLKQKSMKHLSNNETVVLLNENSTESLHNSEDSKANLFLNEKVVLLDETCKKKLSRTKNKVSLNEKSKETLPESKNVILSDPKCKKILPNNENVASLDQKSKKYLLDNNIERSPNKKKMVRSQKDKDDDLSSEKSTIRSKKDKDEDVSSEATSKKDRNVSPNEIVGSPNTKNILRSKKDKDGDVSSEKSEIRSKKDKDKDGDVSSEKSEIRSKKDKDKDKDGDVSSEKSEIRSKKDKDKDKDKDGDVSSEKSEIRSKKDKDASPNEMVGSKQKLNYILPQDVLLAKALKLLKLHFGHTEFRSGQYKIIENIMNGEDSLVIMPTGGGKSICYQMPALLYNSGITIVISPLISLMLDQVEYLRSHNVPCAYINMSISSSEIISIYDQMISDELKLVYIAPERLNVESFAKLLKSMHKTNKINLFAIDEAHCISEWGSDFRTDYRKLGQLRIDYPNIPIVALTASATKEVRQDILSQLRLDSKCLYISSFDRPNIFYSVQLRTQKIFLDAIKKYINQSIIIYCFSRKVVEKLVQQLNEFGYNALPYHAGLDSQNRAQTQRKFLNGNINIIVATVAFGMGINKSNVRLVIHYNLPKSIESYYQETGRAGRDGLQSECILLYSSGDLVKPTDSGINKMEDINYWAITDKCRRKLLLKYFGEDYSKDNCNSCDNCINVSSDVTHYNQKSLQNNILCGIHYTNNRFGSNYIGDILMGKKLKKINNNNHNTIPVFGIEKYITGEEIQKEINELVNKRYIDMNIKSGYNSNLSFATLSVTHSGRENMNLDKIESSKKSDILKKLSISKESTSNISKESTTNISKESNTCELETKTIEELNKIRKEIAQDSKVAPFIVFNNATIKEMAQIMPKNMTEFSNITGVGKLKLEKYGPTFLKYFNEL